jgi:MFS family permease
MDSTSFRLYWAASFCTQLSFMVFILSFPLWTLEVSGSPAMASIGVMVGLIPIIFFGSIIGRYIDYFGCWKMLVGGELLAAAALTAMCLLQGHVGPWVIVILSGVRGGAASITGASRPTALRELVLGNNLLAANAALSTAVSISIIAGPLLSAAVGTLLTIRAALLASAILCILSASFSIVINLRRRSLARSAGNEESVADYLPKPHIISVVWRSQSRNAFSQFLVIAFCTGSNAALFTIFLNEIGYEIAQIGSFMAAQGAGMVTAGLVWTRPEDGVKKTTIRYLAASILALCLIVFPISARISLFFGLIVLVIFGFAFTTFNIFFNEKFQTSLEKQYLGQSGALLSQCGQITRAAALASSSALVLFVDSSYLIASFGVICLLCIIVSLSIE